MTDLAGVVVAGGHSERFGDEEKALATLDGRPMLRHVAAALSERTDRLVVNCRRDQRDAFAAALDGLDPQFAVDPTPGRGPVAGLRTALRTSGARRAVVAACDLPRLDPAGVDCLVDVFEANPRTDAAIPVVDGHRRPLCAAYAVEPTVEACTTALRYGAGSDPGGTGRRDAALRSVSSRLSTTTLSERRLRERVDPATFRSVDTPAALRALRRADPTADAESEVGSD